MRQRTINKLNLSDETEFCCFAAVVSLRKHCHHNDKAYIEIWFYIIYDQIYYVKVRPGNRVMGMQAVTTGELAIPVSCHVMFPRWELVCVGKSDRRMCFSRDAHDDALHNSAPFSSSPTTIKLSDRRIIMN